MTPLESVSSILVIRFARLGDITLLLPSLRILKDTYANARLTLLTGLPYAPLAEFCPWVDEVISIDRLAMRDAPPLKALRDTVRLVTRLRARKFDLVVDFHSFRETNLLAWLSGARYRIAMKRSDRAYLAFCFNLEPALEDKSIHVAEMFRRVVLKIPGVHGTNVDSFPCIVVPKTEKSRSGMKVALYVGAFAESRRWPAERFGALADYIVRNWGASVLILAGVMGGEAEVAAEVAAATGYPEQVQLLTRLGLPELVEHIASADLLVSNDSGPMHIGSALLVPTLGIFSESLPHHYRPVGPRDRFVRKERVEDVQLGEVVKVLEEMRVRGEFMPVSPGRRPGS